MTWTKVNKQTDSFIKSSILIDEDWFKGRWFISGWFTGDIDWSKVNKQTDNWSKS